MLQNGKTYKEEVHISGRKTDFESIHTDMYNQHKKFMRLRSNNDYSKISREDTIKQLRKINEFDVTDFHKNTNILKNKLKKTERTRNLMFWHDGSTISNHSHILAMVSCLYDPAIFLTDEEYSKSNSVLANIHAVVEKPFLDILVCSPSTDQQLLYSDERLADILKIKKPIQTPDGIPICNTVRAFKGDHPASQFEAGQQKGENYAFHGCCINPHCKKSIPHSFKCLAINLYDRISKIHATASSKERLKNNTIVKLYHHLDLPFLIDEYQQRNTGCPKKTLHNFKPV